MPQAVVNPDELRDFARSLKKFNHELRERSKVLANQLGSLGTTWRDQEHKRFVEKFDENMRVLARFAEACDQHVPYLLRKADQIDEYLQS